MSDIDFTTEYFPSESEPPKKKPGKGSVDYWLLGITVALVVTGLLCLFSAGSALALYYWGDSYFYIKSQIKYAVLGFVVMIVVTYVPYKLYNKLSGLIYGGSLVLLALTLLNRPLNGARRWIIVGSLTFQASELMKFAIIVIFAKMIADRGKRMRILVPGFLHFMLVLVPVVVILYLQPHMSCLIIIVFIAFAMMFVGGTRFWNFVIFAVPVFIVGGVMISNSDRLAYFMDRIHNWLNPFTSTTASGYQTTQGLLAIGSGGLFGLGIGNSRQKHLYVPEAQNDFIYSIICEELGLIGAVFVIILFVVFVIRCYAIIKNCPDSFSSLVVFGVTAQIAIQAFFNMGVVTNLIPNTGISLPFFSSGGTSLLILMAEVGVVLNISRYSKSKKENKK